MDVIARIPGDIIKPGDKAGYIFGAPEGANYGNHKKMTIFELFFFFFFFSMLKIGVCGEYGLHFCTLMNCLTCPLISKAYEVKAGISKGAL